MAVETVTAPVLLDSTGQSILTALQTIAGNIDSGNSTFRHVPISIAVAAWSGSGSSWSATQDSVYVTGTSYDFVVMDESLKDYIQVAYFGANKKSVTGGGITFTATSKPTVTLTGMLYILDANDGKVPVLMESTVVGIANGGTNAATLSGAQQNLGITALSNHAEKIAGAVAIVANGNTHIAITSGQYVYVENHGTLAEGLYKATSNIAANAALSGSNLTAKSAGIGGEVSSLSDQIGTVTNRAITPASGVTITNNGLYQNSIMVCGSMQLSIDNTIPAYGDIASGFGGIAGLANVECFLYNSTVSIPVYIHGGTLSARNTPINSGTYFISVAYFKS